MAAGDAHWLRIGPQPPSSQPKVPQRRARHGGSPALTSAGPRSAHGKLVGPSCEGPHNVIALLLCRRHIATTIATGSSTILMR